MTSVYQFDQIAVVSAEKKKPTDDDRNHYVGLEHLSPDTFEVYNYGSETTPKGEKLVMKKGDVLFGKRRAYQRKVGIAPCDGIFSAHGMVLRPNTEVIDAQFFPFFIKSDTFLDEAIRISVGSLSPTINWQDLRKLRFNLPSLERQKELADLLWAGEELRSAYRRLLSSCDEQVKSRFIEMFGPIGKDVFGWGLGRLKQFCELNPRKPKDISDDLTCSFVPMPAVGEKGEFDASKQTTVGAAKKGFTYFRENDVLFAKITPCMQNGKGAVARGLTNGIGFGSTEFHVLRPIEGISDPVWIYTLLSFDEVRQEAERNMTGSGGQRRVPIDYLGNIATVCPPIERQQEFAGFVDQVDKSKFALKKSLDSVSATMAAILNQELGLSDV